MTLASAITKSLSAWAVGTGNGGLDTGSIAANTWYHVHLIRKDSDGSIDALLSLSPTAPTMPSGYTARRRLGAIKTDASSQLISFVQLGDEFYWSTPIIYTFGNSAAGNYNILLTVPAGIKTKALIRVASRSVASNFVTVSVFPLDVSPYAPIAAAAATPVVSLPNTGVALVAGMWNSSGAEVWTDTSRRIGLYVTSSANTGSVSIQTDGWRDRRGR